MDAAGSIATKFADEEILQLKKLLQRISKEQHQFLMFVRFTAIKDVGDLI